MLCGAGLDGECVVLHFLSGCDFATPPLRVHDSDLRMCGYKHMRVCMQQCFLRLCTIVGLIQDWGAIAPLDVSAICGTAEWFGQTLAYGRARTEGERRRSLAGLVRHSARDRARMESRLAAGLPLGKAKGKGKGKAGKGDGGAPWPMPE